MTNSVTQEVLFSMALPRARLGTGWRRGGQEHRAAGHGAPSIAALGGRVELGLCPLWCQKPRGSREGGRACPVLWEVLGAAYSHVCLQPGGGQGRQWGDRRWDRPSLRQDLLTPCCHADQACPPASCRLCSVSCRKTPASLCSAVGAPCPVCCCVLGKVCSGSPVVSPLEVVV